MKIQNHISNAQKMRKTVHTLPIIPCLMTRAEWKTATSEESDPVFSFLLPRKRSFKVDGAWEFRDHDAFKVRDDFFSIRTAPHAKAFFETYGPLQVEKQPGNDYPGQAKPVPFSGVMRRQSFYLEAFNRDFGTIPAQSASTEEGIPRFFEDLYLGQPLPMEMHFQNPPFATVRCEDVEECLRATLFLDMKEDLSVRFCAREKCGKLFTCKRKSRKVYHSERCARLQAQHDYLATPQGKASIKRARAARKIARSKKTRTRGK